MIDSHQRLYDALRAHRVPELSPHVAGTTTTTLPLADR
jgi:hypothetical protein